MKKKIIVFGYVVSVLALFPFPAFALKGAPIGTCPAASSSLGAMLCNIQQLLNSLVPILIALGVVYFVWGVVRYFIADSEEAKSKGKDQIIYGIIGFAIIIGLWGLVNVFVNTLGFSSTQLAAPQLNAITIDTGASDSTCEMGGDFQGLAKFITCIINNSIIPLIFAIALVMFIWGAVKFFIINSDEEAQREQGKQFMIWGIIALTVMLSVWGLVALLGSTFGLKTNVLPQVCPPGSPQCKK